jgi:hypothetical protein
MWTSRRTYSTVWHKSRRAAKITDAGGKDKTAVMGFLERGGKIRTKVVDDAKKKTLKKEVCEHVVAGSAIFTECLEIF